jgi:hypothetical protein
MEDNFSIVFISNSYREFVATPAGRETKITVEQHPVRSRSIYPVCESPAAL